MNNEFSLNLVDAFVKQDLQLTIDCMNAVMYRDFPSEKENIEKISRSLDKLKKLDPGSPDAKESIDRIKDVLLSLTGFLHSMLKNEKTMREKLDKLVRIVCCNKEIETEVAIQRKLLEKTGQFMKEVNWETLIWLISEYENLLGDKDDQQIQSLKNHHARAIFKLTAP